MMWIDDLVSLVKQNTSQTDGDCGSDNARIHASLGGRKSKPLVRGPIPTHVLPMGTHIVGSPTWGERPGPASEEGPGQGIPHVPDPDQRRPTARIPGLRSARRHQHRVDPS